MKKTLLVLLVLVALAAGVPLVILLSADNGRPRQLVETTFVGFSNAPAGPLALVSIRYLPTFGGCHFPSFEASHKYRGGDWEWWGPPAGQRIRMVNKHLMAFAVENTNEAWRIVIEVKENPPNKWPLFSDARKWWNRQRKIPPDPSLHPYTGSHYFLTNETSEVK